MITVVRTLTTGGERVRLIPCAGIAPDPRRLPRRTGDDDVTALADSIHRHGVLVPLAVRPDGDGYRLVAGERRLRAARALGLESVPCIVLPADERLCAQFAVIESLQRRDLDMFEQAQAIKDLIDALGASREEAARQLSCSASCISNKLRLLRFTEPERRLIRSRGLSERHARAVLRLPDPESRLRALEEIAARGLSVNAAESLVERAAADSVAPKASRSAAPSLTPLVNTLDRAVRALRLTGVNARVVRRDSDGFTELAVIVPTSPNPPSSPSPPVNNDNSDI